MKKAKAIFLPAIKSHAEKKRIASIFAALNTVNYEWIDKPIPLTPKDKQYVSE